MASSFVLCGGFAPEGLALVCLEEIVGMFLDDYVSEKRSSKAADFVDDMVER